VLGEAPSLLDSPTRVPAATGRVLRALTVWQPWAHCIAHLGKRIENRGWRPWAEMIGQVIAIHAAARVNEDEEIQIAHHLEPLGFRLPLLDTLPRGAIVAVARVTGYVVASDSPWFVGPYGWTLSDVIALPEPIACKGAQGLWNVPPDVAARVLKSLEVRHA